MHIWMTFGKTQEEHDENLEKVFKRLRKANLKLSPEKTKINRTRVKFLGHVLSASGIQPDDSNIEKILNFPQPTTVDEVRRFVAMCNFYRKHIANFADISYPLNLMMRKGAQFNWSSECINAFNKLKVLLTSKPVLEFPDFSSPFILRTDASGVGLGAMLCNGKTGKPVAYASRVLKPAETRYETIEQECLAIVWAVKIFRTYLLGRKFLIETDHRPLQYMNNLTIKNSRLTKFRLQLQEYDFEVMHIPGKSNSIPDALSRCYKKTEIAMVVTRAQAAKKQRKSR